MGNISGDQLSFDFIDFVLLSLLLKFLGNLVYHSDFSGSRILCHILESYSTLRMKL